MSLPTDYYAGRHRTQYDGSPLAKQNCAPTTAANGSRAASGGRIDKSGGDVRALVAQSEETSPATPGWSLEDQALACRRLGVAFAITGGGWVALQAAHDAGRFVSVPGDSDQFGDGTCSGAFDGDHSVGIHPGTAADGTWPLADPICPARRQEKPSVIRAYAEKLGGAGFRFGVFTDEVPKEDEVIKAIKGEDWVPTVSGVPPNVVSNGVYRATPDRSAPFVARLPAGTIIRTIAEVEAGNHNWRLTEINGATAYFLRSDLTPLVQGGDPAVDQGLSDYIARVPPPKPIDCAPLVNAARQEGVTAGLRDGSRAVKDAAVNEAALYGG